MDIVDPSDIGVIFGDGNLVKAWHDDLKSPVTLGSLGSDKESHNSHVTSFAFREGHLYSSGYGGNVKDISTGQIVRGFPTQGSDGHIFSLGFLEEKLVALRFENSSLASLMDVNSGEDLALIKSVRGKDGLNLRGHSLDMAITDNGQIYISSENVLEVLLKGGRAPEVKVAEGPFADFIRLGTNGKEVYSISFQGGRGIHRDGTAVVGVPSGRRIAFWNPAVPDLNIGRSSESQKRAEALQGKKAYGYTDMFDIFGNTMVIGTTNHDSKEQNIYSVNLTSRMLNSPDGSKATPQLLVSQAYRKSRVYGEGNALLALPKTDVERIIAEKE